MRERLAEEEIANGDGGHNAGQIGEQAGGHGVTRVADAHTAEVNGENVERGVGAALENARQAPHKGIRPVVVIASTIIPRAPEPDSGFIKAVGSAPTHCASKPQR